MGVAIHNSGISSVHSLLHTRQHQRFLKHSITKPGSVEIQLHNTRPKTWNFVAAQCSRSLWFALWFSVFFFKCGNSLTSFSKTRKQLHRLLRREKLRSFQHLLFVIVGDTTPRYLWQELLLGTMRQPLILSTKLICMKCVKLEYQNKTGTNLNLHNWSRLWESTSKIVVFWGCC